MKKYFIVLSLFFIFSVTYGQEQYVLGSYSCSYFNQDCSVAYFTSPLDVYLIQITSGTQIITRRSDLSMFFEVNNKNISNFYTALNDAKNKFAEWIKVAKNNNITDFEKTMDITFPNGNIVWKDQSRGYISFAVRPTPVFRVRYGQYRLELFFRREVTAAADESKNEQANWVFTSVGEVEELLKLLSPEALKEAKQKTDNLDNLFH